MEAGMKSRSFVGALMCLPMLFAQSTIAVRAGLNDSDNPMKLVKPYVYQPVVTDAKVQAAVDAIDKLAKRKTDEKAIPGMAISIVWKNKQVFAQGYGVRDTRTNEKVDAHTVFQLASVSKCLAATTVASLISEGKISWDSKICDLDPSFAMYEPWVTSQLTIRDLFAHRSGLPDHALDVLEDIGFDRDEILHRARYQKPDSSFRSHYAYTNFGLTEGGVAAAKAYGMTWEEACKKNLYEPLGMSSTSSLYADFINSPNHAVNHVLMNSKWTPAYQRQPDAQSPAGGAASSATDMVRWMQLILSNGQFEGKQIVAAEPLQQAEHPCMLTHMSPTDGLPQFYGLGFNVAYDTAGRLRLSHSGAFACGEATTINLLPVEGLGICVLTNGYPTGVAESFANTFMDLAVEGKTSQNWFPLFHAIFSDPATLGINTENSYKTPAINPTAALANKAYVGTYTNELFGSANVIERDGGLVLQLGPKKMEFPMTHYDRDIFTFDPHTEDLSGPCGLRFGVGERGTAIGVLVEPLNSDRDGWFLRISEKSIER